MAKLLIITSLILFSIIGIAAYLKNSKSQEPQVVVSAESTQIAPIKVELLGEPEIIEEVVEVVRDTPVNPHEPVTTSWPLDAEDLPTGDRIEQLFTTNDHSLPYVKTIKYRSRVDWLKGRPAWISDYASHYKTPSHFIARSLHGKGNYYKQDISNGDHFNVLDPDKDIEFYLLVDLSRCKLWFYLYDRDSHKRVLLKDYAVGLGKPDPLKSSGLLTPRGKYSLGNRIVAYKPKMMGPHNGKRVELIRIFGTRWIPFEKEISNTTAPAKGFGLHGIPWSDDENGKLVENVSSLQTYLSDGCIRMESEDIEEIYAIIASKHSFIELVSDYHDATLPGEEVQ
ncbi:MAG: hypothetical protein K940chlam3_01218 [Chlamydiae bacterium]|nr:hypothetical protein [Chlamydiota bacterium]